MYPFTLEFFHPTGRCSQATPQAVSRLMEDRRALSSLETGDLEAARTT